jgi:hypothetical protein
VGATVATITTYAERSDETAFAAGISRELANVGASLLADPARAHAALLQVAAARKEKLAKKAGQS